MTSLAIRSTSSLAGSLFGTLRILMILFALVAIAGPSFAQGRRSDHDERRQRWEQMSEQERTVLRERFEKLRRMTSEQQEELRERARNFRCLERGLRHAPPEPLRKKLAELTPQEQEGEVRRYMTREYSPRCGRRIREKLSPELLAELEKLPSEERALGLKRYYQERGRPHGSWMLEKLARKLELSEEEVKRLSQLPRETREEAMLRLHRRLFERFVEEKGLPDSVSAEAWARLRALSDREFFLHMRGTEWPEEFRFRSPFRGGGRGSGDWRGGDRGSGRGGGRGDRGVDPREERRGDGPGEGRGGGREGRRGDRRDDGTPPDDERPPDAPPPPRDDGSR